MRFPPFGVDRGVTAAPCIPQTPAATPSPNAGVPSARQSFKLNIIPLARFSHSG
jgi:hypothetical protein